MQPASPLTATTCGISSGTGKLPSTSSISGRTRSPSTALRMANSDARRMFILSMAGAPASAMLQAVAVSMMR